MTRLLAVVLVALTLQSAPSAQAPAVIGTWKLISYETETPDGKRTFPLGQDVEGLAVYLPNGRVSIQFMKRDRPRFESGDAWRGTFEEERAAFRGFFSYAGRYTLDQARSMVTHHLEIAAAPNYVGTDLVRTFAIAGNRLTQQRYVPRPVLGRIESGLMEVDLVSDAQPTLVARHPDDAPHGAHRRNDPRQECGIELVGLLAGLRKLGDFLHQESNFLLHLGDEARIGLAGGCV